MRNGRLATSTAVAIAVLVLGLDGCAAHRKVQPFVMPPFTPVALIEIAQTDDPPMLEEDDDTEDLPPVPVAEGATTPKRQRKRPIKAAVPTPPPDEAPAPAPPQVASTAGAAAPGLTVIGELTPGGDQTPETQREAADLIASNEKRLSALPAETVKSQAALVSNIRNFQKQAEQALRSGDAGGAKTLATKGKLLLDDLEKPGGS